MNKARRITQYEYAISSHLSRTYVWWKETDEVCTVQVFPLRSDTKFQMCIQDAPFFLLRTVFAAKIGCVLLGVLVISVFFFIACYSSSYCRWAIGLWWTTFFTQNFLLSRSTRHMIQVSPYPCVLVHMNELEVQETQIRQLQHLSRYQPSAVIFRPGRAQERATRAFAHLVASVRAGFSRKKQLK